MNFEGLGAIFRDIADLSILGWWIIDGLTAILINWKMLVWTLKLKNCSNCYFVILS